MSADSLAEYVNNLLRQGYSEEQIRDVLRQNNYPESMIDAAFAALGAPTKERAPRQRATVEEQLTSYLRTYLAQGYDAAALKQNLLQQGYRAADIDRALGAATGQSVRHEHHIASSTIIKLALLLILVAGISYGIIYSSTLLHVQSPPSRTTERLLDVTLSLEEETAAPGSTLHATTSVTNMGSGTYDVTLIYRLLDKKEQRLWSDTKTKAVATSFDDSERIPIDESLPEGTYTVMIEASYGGEAPATSSKHLTIASSETPTRPPEDTGNETKGTTIQIITDEREDARDKAFVAAKANESGKAEKLCQSITNQARRDDCLGMITIYDHQASHCDAITSDNARDNCLMGFVINGAYELCPKLTKESNKELCQNLQYLNTLPTTQKVPDVNQYAQPIA